MTGKWNEFSAHAVVREIIAENPDLMAAVVSGITAGHQEATLKLREQLVWSNMAMDAALMLATKRATPAAKELLERCVVKRIELFGAGLNEAEKDFLASVSAERSK